MSDPEPPPVNVKRQRDKLTKTLSSLTPSEKGVSTSAKLLFPVSCKGIGFRYVKVFSQVTAV